MPVKRWILLGLTFMPTALGAQTPFHPHRGSGLLWERSTPLPGGTSIATHGILGDGSKDHRYGGMWAGLGLGIVLTAVNYMYCSDPDTGCDTSRPLTYGPIMTVAFGTVGALIGAQVPKTPPKDTEATR